MRRRALSLLCRWIVGAVFIYASVDKILHPAGFALAVFRYQLLPHAAINLFALVLPWLELGCGLALLLSRTFRDAAALIVMALLLVFIGAMAANMARGIDVACGCFSVNPENGPIGAFNLVRNVALFILALVAFRDGRRTLRSKRLLSGW